MPISYANARGYLGQTVVAHCRGARHVGVVRNVTQDGIWLERSSGRGVPVSATGNSLNVETADRATRAEGEEVFFPLLFLPFFTLLALAPLYARPYGYWW